MGKYLKAIVLLLFLPALCYGISPAILDGIGGGSGGGVNFTADANCMGAWFMNNDGGNETDRSGEGGTLTQTGGTIPIDADDSWSGGGVSRDFTAADTEWLYEADGGSTDINGANQELTICLWFKPDANDSTYKFVGKWEAGGDERQYALVYTGATDDLITFGISDNGDSGYETAVSTATVTDTNWHHVCGVYDDVEMIVYLDNVAGTPVAYTLGINNSASEFRIGQYDDSDYMDGLIDEVIIFDRALSAAEVSNIYTYGIDGSAGEND